MTFGPIQGVLTTARRASTLICYECTKTKYFGHTSDMVSEGIYRDVIWIFHRK
jgi:hypothetical protein